MIDETLLEAEEKMDKAVEVAKDDFATIRTGRANAAMFSKVFVDYYGSPTPLQQLASFNVTEARTILVSPFDKSSMSAIEKALRDSDLGVNPTNDGNVIRVVLPAHLRNLARVNGEVDVEPGPEVTLGSVLDALEAQYPVLRGTIRDRHTQKRRPFVRYFACEQDLSHDPLDTPLPAAVVDGREPLLVVGAMAGG